MLHQLIPQPTARDIAATLIAESLSYPPGSPDWEYRRRAWRERMTQIDTSKEAVERLALLHEGISFAEATGSRQCLVDVDDARFMHDLAAERDKWFEGAGAHHVAAMREAQRADQQTARADAAEAREQALLSTYDAERKVMVENVALRAEVARLTAELTALRAGHNALVAAAYEAAADHAGGAWFFNFPTDDRKEPYHNAARAIHALTPADATAALDAMLRAERNKALRDAADACRKIINGRVYFNERARSDDEEFHDAILAMIEPEEPTNE